MSDKKKLAVFFPGVGYHVDKPLLYYSRKIAAALGYETICVEYGKLLSVKRDKNGMPIWAETEETVLQAAKAQLKNVNFFGYERVVFVAKSIGTVVASALDKNAEIGADHIFYTPVAESFCAMGKRGIVFHGTADPLAETEVVKAECEKRSLPLHIIKDGNHSLETGNVLQDIGNMKNIMEITKEYLQKY